MDIDSLANDKKSNKRKYVFVLMKDKNNNYVYISCFERVIHNKEINSRHKVNNLHITPAITLTNREYNQIRSVINDFLLDKKGTAYTIFVSVISGEIHIDKCDDSYEVFQKASEVITTYPISKIRKKLSEDVLLGDIFDEKTSIAYATQEPNVDYFGLLGDVKKGSKEENRIAISSSLSSLIMKFFRKDKVSTKDMNKIFSEENRLGIIFKKAIQEIKDFYSYISSEKVTPELIARAKEYGFQDDEIAKAFKTVPLEITAIRYGNNIFPNFREMDNCKSGNYHTGRKSYFSNYTTSDESTKAKENRILLSNNLDEIIENLDIISNLYIETDLTEIREKVNQFIY